MNAWYLLVPVLLPCAAGLAVMLCPQLRERRNRNIFTAAGLIFTACALLPVLIGGEMRLPLFSLSGSMEIFLRADTAGKIFAAVMAFLWAAAGIYSSE